MLNDKQIRFCEEYLISFNATDAAIKAGYSKKTARSIASEHLTKPDIQAYLQQKRQKLATKFDLSQETILDAYRKLSFYDARKFYDENGNLISVPDLDDETAFALAGFEVMEEKGGNGKGEQVVLGHTKKIKMSDRKGALDSICKVLGYNAVEKQEIQFTQPLNDNQVDKIIKEIRENKI